MKRALIIVAAAVVLAGIGVVGAYFMFFADKGGIAVAPAANSGLPLAGQVSPSSSGGGSSGGSTISTPGASNGTPVAVSTRLVQISAGPVVPGVAAVSMKAKNASSSPSVSVSFIERESGNVFTYLTETKSLTRINNKTLPGIEVALWLPDASVAFVRYLSGNDFSTVNTYALASSSQNGFFLSQNLSGIAVSSSGVLTLASGVNGTTASLLRTDGTRPSTVFTTPLTSIRASFLGKNQYLIFSKPSASLPGSAFMVDGTTRFSRIAGPLRGLVALPSPLGKWLLVSYTTDGGTMQMKLVNTATGSTVPLPVATIADKCVWTADDTSVYCGVPVNPNPSYTYPDDWYQGAAHFSDRIWKIEVAGRFAQLVLDFKEAAKGDLDAEALAIDPLKTTLVFVNRNDDSLWSYAL